MGKQLSTVTQQVREAGPSRNLQADVSALCRIFRPLHISLFLLPDKSQICLFSPLQFALQATAGVTFKPSGTSVLCPRPFKDWMSPQGQSGPELRAPLWAAPSSQAWLCSPRHSWPLWLSLCLFFHHLPPTLDATQQAHLAVPARGPADLVRDALLSHVLAV